MDVVSLNTWLIKDFFISMISISFRIKIIEEKLTKKIEHYSPLNNHTLKTSAQM